MSQTNTPSGADVDLLAGIENAGAIGELLRERRWTRNYEAAAAKCDAELAKYPADDVARVAFEDALYVATCQFNKHFSKTYADNGLPPISTPELMHPAAVAALLARNEDLEAERDALAAERDKQQDTSREWAQRASALAAENKALWADAERYRAWRDVAGYSEWCGSVLVRAELEMSFGTLEECRNNMDAALAHSSQGE